MHARCANSEVLRCRAQRTLGIETMERSWVDSMASAVAAGSTIVCRHSLDIEFALIKKAETAPLFLGRCGTRCTWSTLDLLDAAVENPVAAGVVAEAKQAAALHILAIRRYADDHAFLVFLALQRLICSPQLVRKEALGGVCGLNNLG